jgi:nucleotidyltransferase/DNA polymerase involved in DNA repair
MKQLAKTPAKLTDLPNIGKVTAEKLARIGIKNQRDFLRRDPYRVFERLLKEVDPTLCRCVLASLVGAKTGKRWHRITKQTAEEYANRHPRHRWGPC